MSISSSPRSARTRILTGSIPWEMARFGAPIAVGMGLQTTFNLVDSYVISRLAPDAARASLGALGICDQLSAIGTIVTYGVTTASTAMIALAQGRGDKEAVRRIAWQSILLVGALSVLFGFASILLAGPLIQGVVGAKGDVARLGVAYLQVNSGGSFAIFFLLQLTAIQRALGSAKTPVALLVLSNVLNLFFAVVMVYGPGDAPAVFEWGPPIARALHIPRMELLGAAWATILARTITLVPVVWLLVKRFDVLRREAMGPPDAPILREMGRIAWPSSVQFVVRMFAMLATQTLVARAFTTASDQSATTALGIVFRLEMMALFVAMGWGSAAQTFVGQNLGGGREDRARASGRWSAVYNALFMIAIVLAFRQAARPIVVFFCDDPKVVEIALGYVFTISWSYVGLGTGVVLGSAIAGAGATRTTLVTDLAIVIAFQIPACSAAVLLPHETLERLWWCVAATYLLSGIVYAIVFSAAPWTKSTAFAPTAPALEA
jgi:putative MATE family efflux protein